MRQQNNNNNNNKNPAAYTDHINVKEIAHCRMNLSIFFMKINNTELQNTDLFTL